MSLRQLQLAPHQRYHCVGESIAAVASPSKLGLWRSGKLKNANCLNFTAIQFWGPLWNCYDLGEIAIIVMALRRFRVFAASRFDRGTPFDPMTLKERLMMDFDSVLSDANQLSTSERMRLINALWDTVPEDAELPLSAEWEAELERRVTAIEQGTATTTSWDVICAAALGRIGHGDDH
ncbi:MAG: addiction module component, family [Planctomycetaceae bacterium]|nr:addiction module component, family [Planctomycetaceae bacterium]